MRILVAEDDRTLREVLQRGLREAGYVVDVVADGEAATTMLKDHEYEVAILDWRMPKRSGIETIALVRKMGVTTPILILTARDAPLDLWRARRSTAGPPATTGAAIQRGDPLR
jgi:two-component system response regulator QseB